MSGESDGVLSWPSATPSEELAATKREVADLRRRVVELEAENERLAVAARGREDVAHSTMPLRAVGVSDIAHLFGLHKPAK